ncbi:NOP protein chaperone 1 [Diceros bicornis minor]|uniref:NOP protein chaperone 1 n=1 Tax=Diceros bicornis minor TaxID=77932 RepID=UPI0026EF2701|nr:NOP protein chaperone 1 [Diceros bicornis minor]
MEVHGEPQSSPSSTSSPTDGSGASVSKELLAAGSGGRGGIWDRLLINSKTNSKKNPTLQTVRIERSPLLDQVQSFLPQMAQANEKLRKEIAAAPPGRFNIENIDETLGEVIQMDVALFEMNQSDSKEEDSSEESSQDSSADGSESEDEDDSSDSEVTIDNIKLPHSEDGKGKIEVLDSPASERKEIVK